VTTVQRLKDSKTNKVALSASPTFVHSCESNISTKNPQLHVKLLTTVVPPYGSRTTL
jgi:hypothetical protein